MKKPDRDQVVSASGEGEVSFDGTGWEAEFSEAAMRQSVETLARSIEEQGMAIYLAIHLRGQKKGTT